MKNGRTASRETLSAARLALGSLSRFEDDLEKAISFLKRRKEDVVVTGIGKSSFIAQKFVATLTSLGVRSSFLHPVEAMHGDLGALSKGDVLIAFSASGESREVLKLVEYSKKHFKVPVISFVCREKSSLEKLSQVTLRIEVKSEGSPEGVAPMASTTAMMALSDMLATWLTSSNFKKESFAKLHPGGSLGLELSSVREIMRSGRLLPVVGESDNLKKVLEKINQKKLGVTAVIDRNHKLVGVVTDGDIRRALTKTGDLRDSLARDLMTRSPKTLGISTSLKEALATMENYKITTLFVVSKDKRLEGIVHMHDIVEINLV